MIPTEIINKKWKRTIHPSHKIKEECGIVSCANSDRFGSIKTCQKCGYVQTSTVGGTLTDNELWEPCEL